MKYLCCFTLLLNIGCCLIFMGCHANPTTVAVSPEPTDNAEYAEPLPTKSRKAILLRTGANRFLVSCTGITKVVVRQHGDSWCWAACAEMLHRYEGAPLTQEQIVQKIKKRTDDGHDAQSADDFEIWLAMNPDQVGELARREKSWDKPNTATVSAHFNLTSLNQLSDMAAAASPDEVVQEISCGNPCLIGMHGGRYGHGHILLIYGVEYSRIHPGEKPEYRDLGLAKNRFAMAYSINKLLIVDPQPQEGEPAEQALGLPDLDGQQSSMDFTIGKTGARQRLITAMKVWYPTPGEMPPDPTLAAAPLSPDKTTKKAAPAKTDAKTAPRVAPSPAPKK